MKVGIVTFHNAHNYGAILQSIALKNVIQELGYDCEIVDYQNNNIKNNYRVNLYSLITGLKRNPWRVDIMLSRIPFFVARFIRSQIFKFSIKKYCTPISLKNFKPELFVFGSDQIWNGNITGDDDFYLGNIPGFDSTDKVSYAASLGLGKKSFLYQNKILLKTFRKLGVREESLMRSLEKIGLESTLNIDPTLLLPPQKWERILSLSPHEKTDKEYVLIYAMRDRNAVLEIASRISKESDIPIKEIKSKKYFSVEDIFTPNGYASVREFVRLIRNASIVITDSFHGTVFSILFNTPFYSVSLKDKGDDRIQNLIEKLKIDGHFETPKNIASIVPDKISDNVYLNLKDLRNHSIQFLIETLKDHRLSID